MRRKAPGAIALLAILVLALPALASANWTHKGKGELAEDAAITLSGNLSVTTAVGKVTCPTSIGATLTKSSSAGDVTSYTVSKPSECDLTETLGAACGTNGVTKVEKTGTWGLTAGTSNISLSSIDVHFTFKGCFIPGIRLKGTSTLSVDKTSAISTMTPSGSQTVYNALGEEVGSGSLGGTLSVSPAATYGIKPDTTQTLWLMENEPLGENGEMTLSGNFSFSGSIGSVTCPATAKLSLTAGEVEEGEPEGEVKSFTVASPSECDVGGAFAPCATHSITSVEKTGTWGVTTNGEDISISNLVLDYKFKECSTTTVRIQGNATLAVEEPGAIEEVTFGGSLSAYNGFEEKIGTVELGGSPSASPSGTYQIAEKPPLPSCGEGEPKSSEWSHEGQLLTKACGEEFSGVFTLLPPSAFGRIECALHIATELEPEGGGITELEVTVNTCEGTGAYAGCEVVSSNMVGAAGLLPTSKDFDIQGLVIESLVTERLGGPGCSVEEMVLVAESATATPNSTSAIGSISLSGLTIVEVFGLELEGEIEGELEAANAGTFGIG